MLHVPGIREAARISRRIAADGKTLGFVPTMGALHEGHLSLVREARGNSDFVVVSIFVNPLQFGAAEDLDRYPRDLEGDSALLENAGADLLFTTAPDEMYPTGFATTVHAGESISGVLCGRSRPRHFTGVLTVVVKLFNIVRPDMAFFGQKDFQQAVLITRMAEDLNFPLKIKVCPIIREPDGLAMSSRNTYLSVEERKQAVVIHRALTAGREAVESGERDPRKLVDLIRGRIAEAPLAKVDYIEVVDRGTLKMPEKLEGATAACAAVFFGKTRLIDNEFIDI